MLSKSQAVLHVQTIRANIMIYDFLKFASIPNIDSIYNWTNGVNPFKFSNIRKTEIGEPEWYVCSINLSNTPIGSINSLKFNASAGTSIYLEEAINRCIGEAIERYCSSTYFLSDKAYFRNVDESKGFARCAECENAPDSFKPNGIHEKIEHTQVIKLVDSSIDYLPYETVHLGFLKKDSKKLFTSPISTGCSFFTNKETAIMKGILEVIERDAMMRWWYLNFPDTRCIDLHEIIFFDIQERVKRISQKNIVIYLFEISQFQQFPVVFCLLKSEEFPYACFGASCDTNIKRAIIKALDEAMSIRTMARWKGRNEDIDTTNFEWITQLTDHMELYANWKDAPIINKISTSLSENTVSIADYQESYNSVTFDDLKIIARELADLGFDIFYKDLTLPEISSLGYVVRVVIPQMIPLSQSFKMRWLSSILKEKTISEINIYPQPFS